MKLLLASAILQKTCLGAAELQRSQTLARGGRVQTIIACSLAIRPSLIGAQALALAILLASSLASTFFPAKLGAFVTNQPFAAIHALVQTQEHASRARASWTRR